MSPAERAPGLPPAGAVGSPALGDGRKRAPSERKRPPARPRGAASGPTSTATPVGDAGGEGEAERRLDLLV